MSVRKKKPFQMEMFSRTGKVKSRHVTVKFLRSGEKVSTRDDFGDFHLEENEHFADDHHFGWGRGS